MKLQFKIAETPSELDGVFRLRHQVFAVEEGYFAPRGEERIYDRFDAFPTTTLFIAVADEKVIGTVRITLASPAGTPTDSYFDFHPFISVEPSALASATQLCIARAYRKPGVHTTLMGILYTWCCARGIDQAMCVANPRKAHLFSRAGWTPIAPMFLHAEYQLGCVPMLLNLEELKAPYSDFVQQYLPLFLSSLLPGQEPPTVEMLLEDNLNLSPNKASASPSDAGAIPLECDPYSLHTLNRQLAVTGDASAAIGVMDVSAERNIA